jgi:hypothetical protein
MKSAGKDLDRAFQQAQEYFDHLPTRDLPRYVLVSNFHDFRLFDMELGATWNFTLRQLPDKIKLFAFIPGYEAPADKPEIEASIKAAQRMGKLFEALEDAGYGKFRDGHDLRVLMVRLLFCLFADDTGIFQPSGTFKELVEQIESPSDMGRQLNQLFEVLNTAEADRPAAWAEDYAAFRYINGKLFEETVRTPPFDARSRELLLEACAINWSHISPAIFGSLFQSIKDRDERRKLGEHYTSEENILKLIKPLFLDGLWAEFERVKRQKNRLFDFHKKLRTLTFFDPACGCGNFLVIAYRELRRLELAVLRASQASGQQTLDVHILSQINVDQFHGIEIEEFPAQIAQVALWLTDHQMNRVLTEEFGHYFERLPLVTQPHIVRGNALEVDWEDVLPAQRCRYILGNPPFVGKKEQSPEQKADVAPIFASIKGGGVLDLVAAWYVKATQYARSATESLSVEPMTVAFVSTNSIAQGEQVGVLWGLLLSLGVKINFAYRTFQWQNEASGKAAVQCVIIGFSLHDAPPKVIFETDGQTGGLLRTEVSNINPYLVDAPTVLLEKRGSPICSVPPLNYGSMANDDGHFILDDSERREFLRAEPDLRSFIRPYMGGQEFLHNERRWCLWLQDATPTLIRNSPELRRRVDGVRRFRAGSNRAGTRKLASTPTLFGEVRQPKSKYLFLPKVSSENRPLMPIGFMPPNVVANGSALVAPMAEIFHFGILQSTMHMAWMRAVAGRLESRYQYSAQIVYNNFPWPVLIADLDTKQAVARMASARAAIEIAAQGVLDARALFPDASLAVLYDPDSMPPALAKTHQKLDAAVDKAYLLCGGKKAYKNDAERVAYLFELYQQITSLLPAAAGKPARRKARAT